MAGMEERGPIFDDVPSGPTIMDWFIDKTLARQWVGCGGDADYILSWDPETGTGSHLDLIAHVDHDSAWYWLLSVGVHQDNEPTTYDLLFVSADLDGVRSHQWRNEPSSGQPWHYEGLVWFAGQITEREAALRAEIAALRKSDAHMQGLLLQLGPLDAQVRYNADCRDEYKAQRDEAVRALRAMADGIGVDWSDHPVLSQKWADRVEHIGSTRPPFSHGGS